MSRLEIKIKIVEKGESTIFKNWHENAGIKKEDFIEGLKWLEGDPRDEKNRMTRELGCDKNGLVKLVRAYDDIAGLITFYEAESGGLWNKMYPCINQEDRI